MGKAMKNPNFMTVSQYATAKGISKQAVYKQLNNRLKNFVKLVDGIKYIDVAALGESETTFSTEREQPIEQGLNNQDNHEKDFFKAQIAEKDKTIETLLKQIDTLQTQNGNLTELLKNSQILLAQQQQLYLESKNPQEQSENTEEETETITNQDTKKKGFFGIFKKK